MRILATRMPGTGSILIPAAVALALALSGCNGDDTKDGPKPSATVGSTTPASTAPATTTAPSTAPATTTSAPPVTKPAPIATTRTPTPEPPPAAPAVEATPDEDVSYKNCAAAEAAGAAPVRRGEPGYGPHLDADGDGTGCESDRDPGTDWEPGVGTTNGSSSGSTSGGSSGGSVSYKNCAAVKAAGADPIHRGEPGYASHLDRDGDGTGCE